MLKRVYRKYLKSEINHAMHGLQSNRSKEWIVYPLKNDIFLRTTTIEYPVVSKRQKI